MEQPAGVSLSFENHVSPEPLVPCAQAQPAKRGKRLWGQKWILVSLILRRSRPERVQERECVAARDLDRLRIRLGTCTCPAPSNENPEPGLEPCQVICVLG